MSEIDGEYAVNFGVVALTEVGRQLAGIAGAEPVEGFLDFLEAEWSKQEFDDAFPFSEKAGGYQDPRRALIGAQLEAWSVLSEILAAQ